MNILSPNDCILVIVCFVSSSCSPLWTSYLREAVRIQARVSVLNKRGEYNRCHLTRMVVDVAWEREKWEEAWEVRDVCVEGGEEDAVTVVRNKRSRKGANGGPCKVRKVEGGWG